MPKFFAPKASLIYAAQFCSSADLTGDLMLLIRGASDERMIFNMDQDGFNFTKNGVEYHVPPRGWVIEQQGIPGYSVLTEEEMREKYRDMSSAPATGTPMEVKVKALELAIARLCNDPNFYQTVDIAKQYESFLMAGK